MGPAPFEREPGPFERAVEATTCMQMVYGWIGPLGLNGLCASWKKEKFEPGSPHVFGFIFFTY